MKHEAMNMKTKLTLLLLLLLSVFVHTKGADNLRRADTRALGLGASWAVYSSMYNPSLTAFYAHRQVRADYFDPYGSIYCFDLNENKLLWQKIISILMG